MGLPFGQSNHSLLANQINLLLANQNTSIINQWDGGPGEGEKNSKFKKVLSAQPIRTPDAVNSSLILTGP